MFSVHILHCRQILYLLSYQVAYLFPFITFHPFLEKYLVCEITVWVSQLCVNWDSNE